MVLVFIWMGGILIGFKLSVQYIENDIEFVLEVGVYLEGDVQYLC